MVNFKITSQNVMFCAYCCDCFYIIVLSLVGARFLSTATARPGLSGGRIDFGIVDHCWIRIGGATDKHEVVASAYDQCNDDDHDDPGEST